MSHLVEAAPSIPARFAQVAARHAHRVAVSAGDTEWTYAELDQRSTALAIQMLDRLGEKSEPVALVLAHDAPLIAAILGVLKAGKMYFVLDPSQPGEWLAEMVSDSQARLLLTDSDHRALASSLASKPVQVMEWSEGLRAPSTRASLPEIPPAAGAWLMYTSGSTSAPKGVWQNHCGVLQHADVYRELIQLTPDDRLSLLTSCSLSASGSNLYGALLHGATLCPFPLRSLGVARLAAWLRQQRISVYHSVPTVFRHLARVSADDTFETVRLVRLGGEPVLRGDVEIFRQRCPDRCRLMHSLSSTETGLISALTMDRSTAIPDGRVPVGRAVRDVEIFLVDEASRPVAAGREGRIAIRSAFLRQGYWRQPELTVEKFRADKNNPEFRTFISNDVGRFLPDGSLEHRGRADQLVKIRGQRVDPGEVEAVLLATGLVQEAVVMAHETEDGEKRLAAYFVPSAGANASPQNLRLALRGELAEHMIPSEFMALEKLPQTAGGKIDRRALPKPATRATRKKLSRKQRPRDAIDRRLMRIWELVLNFSPVSRTDDFFDLGGTSLQSVEVLLHIEESFGVSLPPSTLVEYSTIEKLAGLLADRAASPSLNPLVKLRDGTRGRPLFLVHTGQGDLTSFGLLARRLPGRPIYGLQSIGLQGESWPLMSVSAMARRYLPEILTKDPTGPYLLAGACMGGLVALELAQLLVQQNRRVGLLALLDTSHPVERWRQPGWKEKLYCPARDNVRDALRILRWSFLRASRLGRSARWLPGYRRFVANMNFLASRFYQPKPFPGSVTLVIATGKIFPGEDRRLLMRRYGKDSTVIAIPTNHLGFYVSPAVDELARRLQHAMEEAEPRPADNHVRGLESA